MLVKDLTKERIIDILIEILPKEGYLNVRSLEDDTIVAKRNEGLNKIKFLFLIYTETLSGNEVDLHLIFKKINNSIERYKPDILNLIVNKNLSSKIQGKLEKKFPDRLKFIESDQLNYLINEHFPNFWAYEDFDLTQYEKYFLEEMTEQSALKNIPNLSNKVSKLLSIYIKPKIFEVKEDLEHQDIQFYKISEKEIALSKKSGILEGDAGSGKSSILREIGKYAIKQDEEKRKLPVFIGTLTLIENGYDLKKAIDIIVLKKLRDDWRTFVNKYKVLILLDGIDEVESSKQDLIIKQLIKLEKQLKFQFLISTRSAESRIRNLLGRDIKHYQIQKFDDRQIKSFVAKFFESSSIGEELIEALNHNRILERIPITPLSISLIALVFEKDRREIPATISDIYDNFNLLILGKITAETKFELIDFNFRERLLSIYALELLHDESLLNSGMTKKQFIEFFEIYFKNKSSKVDSSVLEEFLNYFLQSSGILELKKGLYINFSHRSFLEYYASIEIFKHQRRLESSLSRNFLDLKWQNVAIFYAGRSRDMPDFLQDILKIVQKADAFEEEANSIMGIGYLLQALYQTDNNIRAKAIEISLDKHLSLHDTYKRFSTTANSVLFQKMRLPVLSVMNMYFFYLNHLSVTLTDPMSKAFNSIFKKYKSEGISSDGYKLLTLAAVFHSKQLNDSSYLWKLLDETKLLNDPYLTTVANFALAFNNSIEHNELKKVVRKAISRYDDVVKALMAKPARQLRYSNLDILNAERNVKIVTEGKTDARIIEHAYSILTGKTLPYWSIKPAGLTSGSAAEVRLTLDKAAPLSRDGEIYIGIFDNDKEGIEQFKGLNDKRFEKWNGSERVRKMINEMIFGIKLPIPNHLRQYKRPEIELNYFAIEHYFSIDFLHKHKMVDKPIIDGVYKIVGNKNKFADEICKISEPKVFEHFVTLFKTVDEISNIEELDYLNRL